MDGSANELLRFLVWSLQGQQWVSLCNCLVGALPYSHYVMRSFPLCAVRVLFPAQYDLLANDPGNRPPQKKTVRWLSSSCSDWHVLQRRCQLTPTSTCIQCLCFTASVPTEANYYIYQVYIKGGGGGRTHLLLALVI